MSVKSELDATEEEAKEHRERARAMIEVAVIELETLKKSLGETERREQQVDKISRWDPLQAMTGCFKATGEVTHLAIWTALGMGVPPCPGPCSAPV